MFTFKDFLLQETRSHPDLNPKISINQRLKDYYNRAPKAPPHFGLRKNAFVSFTKYERLGINPRSTNDTPIGISAYPIEYALEMMGMNKPSSVLPKAGNQPYANCFTAKGIIVNINKFPAFTKYKVRLKDICEKEGIDFDTLWTNANETAYLNTPGAIFWNATYLMSEEIASKRFSGYIAVWNGIIRSVGIDGIIDNGSGIIHTNELAQSLFLHIGCIYNIQRFDNKWT